MTGVEYLDDVSDTESFTMDALGNRTSATLRGESSKTYAVDDLTNRYDETGTFDVTLGYDDAGNTTVDQDGYQYAYDYENRIIKIEDAGDATIATFEYDALGRRIAKVDASVISIFDAYFPHLKGRFFRRKSTFDVSIKVDSIASETTYYYYNNQWQVLCEHDGTSFGNVYIYGNYIDEAVFMSDGVSIYYYAHNHLFSPVALLSSAGAVVERYEYNAYGQVAVLTDDDADTNWFDDPDDTVYTESQLGNPYLFTGRRLDTLDDGDYDVMYYRNRYYDTQTGRFLTEDPLGINPAGSKENPFEIQKQYQDGVNIYIYALNSPMNFYDPFGTTTLKACLSSPAAMKVCLDSGMFSWGKFGAQFVGKKGSKAMIKLLKSWGGKVVKGGKGGHTKIRIGGLTEEVQSCLKQRTAEGILKRVLKVLG